MITIVFPFSIGGGRVSTTNNESRILQSKLMLCLGTMVGERVMRPGWGIDLLNHVHAIGGTNEEVIEEAIRDAFQRWFSRYQLVEVRARPDTHEREVVDVEVRYKKPGKMTTESTRMAVRMPDGTVSVDGEVAY